MIICLEGPSAAGKTTACRMLQEELGAAVVPEVNALFERPASEPENWYLARQVERWSLANQALATHPLAVLDGDPFQPLWYNWSFGFQRLQPLEMLAKFYRPCIANATLGFPDVYVHLVADPAELRRRRDADLTRSRRNFDSHLRLADTQPPYFAALNSLAPARVQTFESVSPESVTAAVKTILEAPPTALADPLALFDGLIAWLEGHPVEA